MKRIMVILLASAMFLTGCGPASSERTKRERSDVSESEREAESSDDREEITADDDENSADEESSADDVSNDGETDFHRCIFRINDDSRPEVAFVSLSGNCSEAAIRQTRFENLYGVNVIHSGVVGLVGAPVEVTYAEELDSPELTFYYNKDELRGVPEKNLIVLHYNEKDCCYDELMDFKLDTEKCSVSVGISETGVYMLADAYQWLACWGYDVSEYAYERDFSEYISDWERECETGSIPELADKKWAAENAPYFNVSTPEELASVVYYVNACDTQNPEFTITLSDDIDLDGYDWVPMGWSKGGSSHAFSGELNGGGHTISNMKIDAKGKTQVGFIGYGLSVTVHDITFADAEVSGSSQVGILGGELYICGKWTNVHVSGKISASGTDYGAIIGREAGMNFGDCSCDVTVNGEPFEYFTYLKKVVAETEVTEAFTLTENSDGSITRDEVDGYSSLSWYVYRNGDLVLQRNAEDETTLPAEYTGDTVYLAAYINGAYIRVSNIIER